MFKSVILCGYGKNLYPLIESNSISTNNDSVDINEDNNNQSTPSNQSNGIKQSEQIKSLLPLVGLTTNYKIIDFILNRLDESGLNDVLILTPTSISAPLSHHIKQRRNAQTSGLPPNTFVTSFPSTSAAASNSIISPRMEVQEVPDSFARRGTVDVLRWAVDKGLVKTDFIVFPCDLLLLPNSTAPSTNTMSISKLINEHIISNSLITTLFFEREAGNVVDAAKDGPSEILTIYDKKSSSLLDLREMEEYLTDDEIPISTRLLSQFPKPTLSLNLLPTHIYIFSSVIVPYLTAPPLSASHSTSHSHSTSNHSPSPNPTQRSKDEELKELNLIRNRVKKSENFLELVGYFSRLAWKKRRTLGPKLDMSSSIINSGQATPNLTPRRPSLISRSTSYANPNYYNQEEEEDSWDSNPSALEEKGPYGGVKVLVWHTVDGFCARGNTVQGWVELNRAALKLLPPPTTSLPIGISPDSYLHPSLLFASSSSSLNSVSGGTSNFGERIGIKRSIILGKNCFIGRGSKLIGVIVMEGVKIGENVKLENCILSNSVQIRDRASLKDCDLGRGVIIQADASLKNEQLVLELD